MRYQNLIGGRWCDAVDGGWLESVNPYTNEPWCEIPRSGAEDIDRAVEAAHRAFHDEPWRSLSATARGALLRRVGDLIAENADHLAEIEVRDNGKLINEMRLQLRTLPQWYHYYAGLADKIEGAVPPIDRADQFVYTRHEPLGVVAAITPWNSPILLLTWKLAPGLAAGNTFVVKPSELASASTLEFVKLFEEAGFPPGAVNVVCGLGGEAGAPLVCHPKVSKIAFTGSDQAGKAINETAGRHLKHVTLELGGKSPNIVFEDADLDAAAAGVMTGIFAAAGQTCIAGSRLLVATRIKDDLLSRVASLTGAMRIGDPTDSRTNIGPIANRPHYQKVLGCIDDAKREGGALFLGGGPHEDPSGGLFIKPTIFVDVPSRSSLAQEEVFGPVLAVSSFDNDEQAVRLANGTRYGLGAGIWTRSMGRAFRVSNRLQAGTVWVNTYRALSVMSPFGGMKDSGIGRESGKEAIKSYLQVKTVWIDVSEKTPADPFVMRLE